METYKHPISGEIGHAHPNGGGFVAETAHVDSTAYVGRNAYVSGYARVADNAQIFDNAWVYGNAQISGNAWVFGNAQIFGNAWVFGNAQIFGDARVSGGAWVYGKTKIPHGWNGTTFRAGSYPVTVNEGFIQIGCKALPIEAWSKVSEAQAVEMGLPAASYPMYKAFIEMLIAAGVK